MRLHYCHDAAMGMCRSIQNLFIHVFSHAVHFNLLNQPFSNQSSTCVIWVIVWSLCITTITHIPLDNRSRLPDRKLTYYNNKTVVSVGKLSLPSWNCYCITMIFVTCNKMSRNGLWLWYMSFLIDYKQSYDCTCGGPTKIFCQLRCYCWSVNNLSTTTSTTRS